MDDHGIIQMYWDRDDQAIRERQTNTVITARV